MLQHQTFDANKAAEVISYVAGHVHDAGRGEGSWLAEILYHADKAHLSRYGRLICGDRYVATSRGAVPNGVCGILEQWWHDAVNSDKEENNPFCRACAAEALSDSDRECLDAAIRDFVASPQPRNEWGHDGAWSMTKEGDFIDISLIAQTLPNADEVLDLLRDPYPDVPTKNPR